jgi:hypothetical protein
MALRHGGEFFTKWTHVENGQVLVRRLHRLEVQGKDGLLHVLEGRNLPDFIQTCAGEGHRGKHLGQILLGPNDPSRRSRNRTERWPSPRDGIHLVMGVSLCLILVRLLAALSDVAP